MKLAEFISITDSKQFNDWFDKIDLKEIDYDGSEVWKYNLMKKGKIIPFKVAIKKYIIDNELPELTYFPSSYESRNQFCEKFGFDIHEDLVYDQPELLKFKNFYENDVDNKSLFQYFISYCSELLHKTKTEPYKVRAAITSERDAVLLMGMRPVISFSGKKRNFLNFLMDESFDLSDVKHEIRYNFQGNDRKIFVEVFPKDWSQIPQSFLRHHAKEVENQYESVKNKKRVQWNTEANTTNSVLKYLMFKNEKLELFFQTTNTFKMEYFDDEGIKKYKSYANSVYDANSEGKKLYKDTETKLFYLSELLADRTNQKIKKAYSENPHRRNGRGRSPIFRDYIITGVVPDNVYAQFGKDLFIKLAFGMWETIPHFHMEIDINYKDNDNRFNENRDHLRSLNPKKIYVNDTFPDNWNDLVDVLEKDFNKLVEELNNFLNPHSNINFSTNTPMQQPLNQILYGPPGTGKTYHTINKAIQIANPDFNLTQDRNLIKEEYQRLVDEGQIVFTTFHQSMSYEDFIEGIKPYVEEGEENDSSKVLYEIQEGIFKELCKKASFKEVQIQNDVNWDKIDYYKLSLGGKQRPDIHNFCVENSLVAIWYGGKKDLSKLNPQLGWDKFKNEFISLNPKEAEETRYHIQAAYNFLKMKKGDVIVVSKGNHVVDAIGIVESDYFFDENQPIDYVHYRRVKWLATNMNYKPEYFLNKVKISQMTIYEFYKHNIKIEAFKEMFSKEKVHDSKFQNHVLIIDEINRGNVSQIFGELITLIEEDKRLGNFEALEITLPYSKEKFGVPPNLYIIGTMNTADRSVEALDTALRRRFVFEEMSPKYEELQELDFQLFDFPAYEILRTINQRIEKLIDRDHAIGHAYFLRKNEQTIVDSFYKNIIPLLQEYFFGDYGKIGLVLGKGFVKSNEESSVFANFDYEGAHYFEEKINYEIIDYRKGNQVQDFGEAIRLLMNK